MVLNACIIECLGIEKRKPTGIGNFVEYICDDCLRDQPWTKDGYTHTTMGQGFPPSWHILYVVGCAEKEKCDHCGRSS